MTSPTDKPTIAWPATALELKEYLATRNEPTEREKNNAKTERLPMTSPIDKLIALAEEHDSKATKGPFHVRGPDDEPYGDIKVVSETRSLCTLWQDDAPVPDFNAEQYANASLFAKARTAWPATARALELAIKQRDEALSMVLDNGHATAFRKKWDAEIEIRIGEV